MPCGNEVDFIKTSASSILATEYPKEKLEFLVVLDSESNDGTKTILKELASINHILKVLSNPKKVVPFAMNIGIKASKGEIIVRVDAHSVYPKDYISKCVEYLEKTDAWCVGGPFYNKPAVDTIMAKIIAGCLSSPFMVANSKFRTKRKAMYVETVPYGAFRRSLFDKIGLYDERLVRHQDYELCRRITKYGGKIFMTPEIKNTYFPRKTLRELLHKARYYALWDAFSHKICPYTFTWRHFLPGVFFLGTIACIGLSIIAAIINNAYIFTLGISPLAVYFLLAFIFSIKDCIKHKFNFLTLFLIIPTIFLYHFNFGFGIVNGWFLVYTGKWKKLIPQPINYPLFSEKK